MSICKNCGANIAENTQFCTACGKPNTPTMPNVVNSANGGNVNSAQQATLNNSQTNFNHNYQQNNRSTYQPQIYNTQPIKSQQNKPNTMVLIGLIVSVISVAIFPIGSIAGICCSILGLRQVENEIKNNYLSIALAIIGIVLSTISIIEVVFFLNMLMSADKFRDAGNELWSFLEK